MISEPMVCLSQTMHLSCTDTNSVSKWKKWDSTRTTTPRSSIRCVQNNVWDYGTFDANRAPVLHEVNSISERTEMSFHLSLVTYWYHRVSPEWFLSLWYVLCKPWTYLAPTQTLSPKGKKRDSTWSTSPRGSMRCIQNDFRACGSLNANGAPILHQD
jgi:hypothetical protein